jgi:hypothetical protein
MCVPQSDTWSIHGVLVADNSDIASLARLRAACALVAAACVAILDLMLVTAKAPAA